MLLIALTPALLLYENASEQEPYEWVMYSVTALLSLRLIFDCRFLRRPRVEPNMNPQGLSFLCAAALIVLVVRVFVATPAPQESPEVEIAKQASEVLERRPTEAGDADPTTTLVAAPAVALSKNLNQGDSEKLAMEIMALVAHVAIMIGLLVIGYKHFESASLGLAMAALYLMMPCTAYYVHRVTHVLPAAFLIWAFVFYRRPVVAGCLLAFASGALFSTVFLLPLWAAYYGRRRLVRFGVGLSAVGLLLTIPLLLTSLPGSLVPKFLRSMNWSVLKFSEYDPSAGLAEMLRPHFAIVFLCVFLTLTIWPRRKHLGHLIAHSTVLVVLAQLWYPETPGVYVLWYLPMLLLVAFRPRLRHLRDTESEVEATRLAPSPELERPSRSTVAPSPLSR